MRKPLLLIPLLLVLLIGGAVLAAWQLLPGVVRSQGQAWVETNLPGKVLTMGPIRFDPWELRLDIADLAIADGSAPQAPLVTAKSVTVDASASSIWQLTQRLDRLAIDTPVVDAILRKDGSLNLLELMPKDDGSPMPKVWIGDLDVKQGTLRFTDRRGDAEQKAALIPLAFNLKDFSTVENKGGGYTLAATSEESEALQWAGTVGMTPLASAGSFTITGLKLATIGRFGGALLPVALDGGAVDIAGRYHFAAPPAAKGAAPKTVFDTDVTTLKLADLAMTAPTGDRVKVASLTVAPTRLDLAGDSVTIGDMAATGIDVVRPTGEHAVIGSVTLAATRYAIGAATADIGAAAVKGISVTGRGKGAETLALAGVTVAPSQVNSAAQKADIGMVSATGLRLGARVNADNSVTIPGLYPQPARKPAPKAAPLAWKASLAGFRLSDAAVRLAVNRPPPVKPQTLNFTPLDVTIGPLTSALDAPLKIDVDAGMNGKARLKLAGTAAPDGSRADMKVDLAGLSLPGAAAFAPPSPVTVKKGSLGVKGRVQLAMAKGQPQPKFDGQMSIADLEIDEAATGDPLVGWKRLDVTGIRYSPAMVAIARIAFDRPLSHVIVTREQRLNLARVAGVPDAPPEPAPAPETPAGVVKTAADATAAVAEATPAATPAVADASAPAPDKPAKAEKPGKSQPKLRVIAPISNTASAAGKLIPISIGEVTVKGGTIEFSDYSIEPNFSVKIQGFGGNVTGLSTAPGSQARFNLKGYVVDRFSPATLTGRANVFAYDANTDLTASFKNIELPVFNPYSGRFAGYAIARGKLSTTVHYKITNRKLDAQHNVVIDQLKWGEATGSKEKVSLPVRLATSLLKDKNGVIDLDLPVGGTLDDPSFRIWPVVWKILGNLVGKIVAAPFKLIGSIFGGGDDSTQYVLFAPGSAVLADGADKALKEIAKGLAERPEVNLDIPAGPGIREDAEAMTTANLHAAVLAGKKGPVAADYAGLDASKKADKLKALYKARFGKAPKFPDEAGVTKAGLFAGGEAKSAAHDSQIKWLETELRPKYAPTDLQLAELGQARASAVKEALLGDQGLAAERVFVNTGASVVAKDDKVQMELAVKD